MSENVVSGRGPVADDTIVFLTYCNRSGSTYLASKIAASGSVGVGIEAKFADGWIEPGFSIQNQQDLETYLDALYQNVKFIAWSVDRKKLSGLLSQKAFPLLFSEFLLTALSCFFSPRQYTSYLHKCGHYYRCVEEIRKELPRARFLFIRRDPRAVYNSQRKSIDSQTGKPMQPDILHFLFGFLDTDKRLKSLGNDPGFMIVDYEDLLQNEETVMTRVMHFVGSKYVPDMSCKESYFSKVPVAQKHLHKNIRSGKPVASRITGWQKELPAGDILLMQRTLRKYLQEKELKIYVPDRVTLRERTRYLINAVRFYYERTKRRVLGIEHRY